MGRGQVIIWRLRSAALIGILPPTSGSAGCLRVSGWYLPRTKMPSTECGGRIPGSRQRTGCAGREPRLARRCGDGLFLSITAWDKAPGRLHLANRDVRLVWLAYEAQHTVVVRHGTGSITLLVIPPRQGRNPASHALALAPGLAAPRVPRTS